MLLKVPIESVKKFIIEAVLEQTQAVSITVLYRLYCTGYGQENDKIYQNKLKKRIFDEYGDSLKFLKVGQLRWIEFNNNCYR